MRVAWTQRAQARLRAIHAHIQQVDPRAADKVVQTLVKRSKRLGWLGMARSGRAVPEYADPDILEIIISPYRVIYRVLPQRIDVLTVMHERQLLPGDAEDLS